jgi:hypothetical protein
MHAGRRDDMSTPAAARPTGSPKAAVVRALRQSECEPVALIANVARETSLSDGEIKGAIWELISEMKVEFTSAQTLKLVGGGKR